MTITLSPGFKPFGSPGSWAAWSRYRDARDLERLRALHRRHLPVADRAHALLPRVQLGVRGEDLARGRVVAREKPDRVVAGEVREAWRGAGEERAAVGELRVEPVELRAQRLLEQRHRGLHRVGVEALAVPISSSGPR
jgi:hypothetical protein